MYFDFSNIQLIPQKCAVYSRKECDTSVKFNKMRFRLPVIPANMVTVVNEKLCWALAAKNYFYVMHRFGIDNVKFVNACHQKKVYASISIGVKDYDYETIEALANNSLIPEFITIDIAHGHSDRVKQMIQHVKRYLPDSFVIAGNIATPEAARDLAKWGADALKIGVGPGHVCITRTKTGFGTAGWQLSALKEIHQTTTLPLIVDGGLRSAGDIAKAMRFGADLCMMGLMFAGFEESPGQQVMLKGIKYKEYYGSASMFNKKTRVNIEGKKELIKMKGSIWEYLEELEQDVQSAISYSGGRSLASLREVKYVIINGSNIAQY